MTDANVILGYINPTSLLDGAMPIDAAAARRVFQECVAEPLQLDVLDAAYGVHALANASMIRAVKAVSSQRGRDPRKFTLFAFGGSGPVHAAGIARELEIGRIIVPRAPGFFSAFGLLAADQEHHAVSTFLRRTATLDTAELDAAFPAWKESAAPTSGGMTCGPRRSSGSAGWRCATSARHSSCRCRRPSTVWTSTVRRRSRRNFIASTSGRTATGPTT